MSLEEDEVEPQDAGGTRWGVLLLLAPFYVPVLAATAGFILFTVVAAATLLVLLSPISLPGALLSGAGLIGAAVAAGGLAWRVARSVAASGRGGSALAVLGWSGALAGFMLVAGPSGFRILSWNGPSWGKEACTKDPALLTRLREWGITVECTPPGATAR
jgi:hypothetical protein